MASQNKGGHPKDSFIHKHFTREQDTRTKSHRWIMTCKYCPASEASDVPLEQVFDITDLDNIRTGSTPLSIDDEITAVTEASDSNEKWDANSLIRSLGIV